MDTIALLDHAFAWTAGRIGAVPAGHLDAPTPCSRWNLQQLLDHTIGSLEMLTEAVEPSVGERSHCWPDVPSVGSTRWEAAIAELAVRSRAAWAVDGVMERSFDLPVGSMPAPVLASTTMLEVVVHGWDISQATGEAAEIPDRLALPILDFARRVIDDAIRDDNFAADLGIGDTGSDQLVAFLGRKPL